ncbi:MAG TPA: PilZ domain-containing protein [Caulobacteraceae bacterium]
MSEALTSSDPPATDGAENRRELRRRVLLSGRLVHSASQLSAECAIQDISHTGARVRVAPEILLSDPLYLINMSHGLGFKAKVAWRRENRVGLTFSGYYDLNKPNQEAPPILRRLWLEYIR